MVVESGNFPIQYRQSSAKSLWDVTVVGKSFIWQRKSMGPRTVPCGTPESTLTSSVVSPSSTTLIVLFVRKLVSHVWVLPTMPYFSSLYRSFLWGTVSNALLKSKIATSTCFPLSSEDRKS